MGFQEFDRGIKSEQIRREREIREMRELESEILCRWRESEVILGILRSIGGILLEVESREKWFKDECNYSGSSPRVSQIGNYQDPNEWFRVRVPELFERFGAAFVQERTGNGFETTRIVPVQMNDDFFAALLGGQKRLGHQVVHCPRTGFWFYEPRVRAFCPVNEGKMLILLSNYLVRCAGQMPPAVNVVPLMDLFRKGSLLQGIVDRAKVLLEADPCFFEGMTGRPRWVAGRRMEALPEPSPVLFLKDSVERREGATLSVGEVYQHYIRFCSERGIVRMDWGIFKSAVKEAFFELFNARMRHDIVERDGRQTHGWKHVGILGTPAV